jgi:hypothetical protein
MPKKRVKKKKVSDEVERRQNRGKRCVMGERKREKKKSSKKLIFISAFHV